MWNKIKLGNIFALFIMCFTSPVFAQREQVLQVHELLDKWQIPQAKKAIQTLLVKYPKNDQVLLAAARVQLFRGNFQSGLDLFASISPHMQSEWTLLKKHLQESAVQTGNFLKQQSKHFLFRFPAGKEKIIMAYMPAVAEQAYEMLSKHFGIDPAKHEPITVDIVPHAFVLSKMTTLTEDDIERTGTIAICKYGRIMLTSPLSTYNGYTWADTFSHELTHLFISVVSGNQTPIWLHEGLAKYEESVWNGKAGRNFRPHHEQLLREALPNKLVTFEEMHPSMAKLPTQEKAALAFAEVFVAIKYLIEKWGYHKLISLLASLDHEEDFYKAFKTSYGISFAGFEKQWLTYLKSQSYKAYPGLKPPKILITSPQSQQGDRAVEGKNSKIHRFTRLGELLMLRSHFKAAALEFTKAKKLAGIFNPTILNQLAKAYIAQKQFHHAKDELTQLLSFMPDDADGHLLLGKVYFKLAEYEKALQYFDSYQTINPFNPEVHLFVSQIFSLQGNKELAQAEQAIYEDLVEPYDLPETYNPKNKSNDDMLVIAPIWGQLQNDKKQSCQLPCFSGYFNNNFDNAHLRLSNGSNVKVRVERKSSYMLVNPM